MGRLWRRVVLVAGLAALIAAIPTVRWDRDLVGGRGPAAQDAAGRPSTTTPARTDRPNIVFVLTDDLSMNLLPFMPHVQAMQRRGMTFSRFFVTNSLCCPSRSSILTGGYPHTTKVLTNGGADGGYAEFHVRRDDRQTFATSLHAAGYTTALMGKYLNGYRVAPPLVTPLGSIPPGWDEWYVAGGDEGYSGFDYTLNENGRLVRYGSAPTDYITDVLAAKGVDFVDRAAGTGRPFLLEVSTFSPHAPYTPAPRNADDYPGLTYPRTPAFNHADLRSHAPWITAPKPLSPRTKAAIDRAFRMRAQAVRSVDDLVADLVGTLQAKGVLDNTFIVFSSDNGYHMGEHRLGIGKMMPYDTDINVPLVVTGPGVPAGTTSDALVANVDLCPTFEDLGRGARTALVDGRSLAPLLRGQAPADWRKAVLVEHRRPVRAEQVGPDKESPDWNPPSYHAMRMDDALYVEYADGQREYYDLAKDPYELQNLAPRLTPTQRTGLHRSLLAIRSCRGTGSCRAAEGAAHPARSHPLQVVASSFTLAPGAP